MLVIDHHAVLGSVKAVHKISCTTLECTTSDGAVHVVVFGWSFSLSQVPGVQGARALTRRQGFSPGPRPRCLDQAPGVQGAGALTRP